MNNQNNEMGKSNGLGIRTPNTITPDVGIVSTRETKLINDIIDREHELTCLKIREPEELGYIHYLESKINQFQEELNHIQNAHRLQQHN